MVDPEPVPAPARTYASLPATRESTARTAACASPARRLVVSGSGRYGCGTAGLSNAEGVSPTLAALLNPGPITFDDGVVNGGFSGRNGCIHGCLAG